jgi:hypothetical protein
MLAVGYTGEACWQAILNWPSERLAELYKDAQLLG